MAEWVEWEEWGELTHHNYSACSSEAEEAWEAWAAWAAWTAWEAWKTCLAACLEVEAVVEEVDHVVVLNSQEECQASLLHLEVQEDLEASQEPQAEEVVVAAILLLVSVCE